MCNSSLLVEIRLLNQYAVSMVVAGDGVTCSEYETIDYRLGSDVGIYVRVNV